jgi:hypothetical protein
MRWLLESAHQKSRFEVPLDEARSAVLRMGQSKDVNRVNCLERALGPGFIGSLTLPTAVLPSIESDFVAIDQSAQPRALEDGQGFFDPVFVWITLIRGLAVRACSEA